MGPWITVSSPLKSIGAILFLLLLEVVCLDTGGSAVVYAATRKTVEQLAERTGEAQLRVALAGGGPRETLMHGPDPPRPIEKSNTTSPRSPRYAHR